jgi:hypothetical protein
VISIELAKQASAIMSTLTPRDEAILRARDSDPGAQAAAQQGTLQT